MKPQEATGSPVVGSFLSSHMVQLVLMHHQSHTLSTLLPLCRGPGRSKVSLLDLHSFNDATEALGSSSAGPPSGIDMENPPCFCIEVPALPRNRQKSSHDSHWSSWMVARFGKLGWLSCTAQHNFCTFIPFACAGREHFMEISEPIRRCQQCLSRKELVL